MLRTPFPAARSAMCTTSSTTSGPTVSGCLPETTASECRILRASCDFSNVEIVLSGNQQARAVALVPTPEGLYFSSDTPLESNHVYRLDRRGALTELAALEQFLDLRLPRGKRNFLLHYGRAQPDQSGFQCAALRQPHRPSMAQPDAMAKGFLADVVISIRQRSFCQMGATTRNFWP